MYNSHIMLTKKWSLATTALLVLFALSVLGPGVARAQAPKSDIPIEEVIRRFAEKEKEFKTARDNYTFKQDLRIQELSDSDRVIGEYRTVTDISFDEKGRRTEKVVSAPPPTLKRLGITKEDLQDLESIQPFVLTSDDIGLYNLKFTGKKKIDEINCYEFEVSPKRIEKDKRYFEGTIWVDDQDLQIVKTYGKAVPDRRGGRNNENLFPKFETYREQIDGLYWFPTYTRIADTLDFESGPLKMRGIVRYGDYKKFQTSVKLRFGGEVTDENKAAPAADPDKEKLAPALDPKYKTDPKTDKK
jgi:hypothetical protein